MESLRVLADYLIQLQDLLGGKYGALSRPQLRLMLKLDAGPRTVSELKELLRLSSPGVTQMLDKLQTAGWITRRGLPHDLRMVQVELTDSGRSVLAEAQTAFVQRVAELLGVLSAQEVEALTHLLEFVLSGQARGGSTHERG